MLRIDVITLFPDWVQSVMENGVVRRVKERNTLSLHCWNPRAYTLDAHHTVDDRPYGGGPGMVMQYPVLKRCLDDVKQAAQDDRSLVAMLSPQGERFNQTVAKRVSNLSSLILVAGRYEAVDERFVTACVDEEWSLGDFVLSGGELAAMCIIDTVARLLPGTLGDAQSAVEDSFSSGLLDHPHYTRPETVDGMSVPSVLLGGNHQAIARWRKKEALGRTYTRRPDLIDRAALDAESRALLEEYLLESHSSLCIES